MGHKSIAPRNSPSRNPNNRFCLLHFLFGNYFIEVALVLIWIGLLVCWYNAPTEKLATLEKWISGISGAILGSLRGVKKK